MSELAERSKEVADKIGDYLPHITRDWDAKSRPICVSECPRCHLAKLIEQAFLAERRLALEEAAQMAEQWGKQHVANELRAAAEKEVKG